MKQSLFLLGAGASVCLAVVTTFLLAGSANAQSGGKTLVGKQTPKTGALRTQQPLANPTPIVIYLTPAPTPSPSPSSSNAEPKLDKPWGVYLWPPAIQAIVAIIGGGLALWQFNRTYKQKEAERVLIQAQFEERQKQERGQFEKRIDQDREQFAKRTEQERQHFIERVDQDRLHFTKKEQQDQFADIQTRLSNTEPIIRANAALRLGEFAKKQRPRTEAEQTQDPSLPSNPENNPYFLPVASQLVTALYIEERPEIRASLVEAIKSITEFAKKEDQNLLYALIERLAEANRTAKIAFIKAMAEYSVTTQIDNQELDLHFLASVAPFCEGSIFKDGSEITRNCLKNLIKESKQPDSFIADESLVQSTYDIQQLVARAKWNVQTHDERLKQEATSLPRLEIISQQLIATRDTLANALKSLLSPRNFPIDIINENRKMAIDAQKILMDADISVTEHNNAVTLLNVSIIKMKKHIDSWNRQPALNLSKCFLAGANLSGAHLENVNLSGAHLEDATLVKAYLTKVDLSEAYLNGAELIEIHLENAYLRDAHMETVHLVRAHLENANLDDAHIKDANLARVHLENSSLAGANLYNADLSEAHIESANLIRADLTKTKLYSIYVQETNTEFSRKTNFSRTNWGNADFTIPGWLHYNDDDKQLRDDKAKRLFNWLNENFPQNEA